MNKKKRGMSLVLVLALILVLQSITPVLAEAPPDDKIRTKYTVYGYVEDIDTGYDISNALVCIYDQSNNYLGQTTTNGDGYFEKDCYLLQEPDFFKATVSKSQYYTKSKTRGLTGTNCDMDTISLDPYRKYAVVVGIAEYESIGNLPNTDEDALNWTQELISRGFKSQHIIQLINSSATKSNVQGNVSWMADTAKSHDVIAFTFSGHGGPNDINNSNDGFLRTYEFIDDDNATGKYHDDEFFDDISDTDASQAFVFIDACRSGCFIDEFGNASSGVKSRFFVISGCPWDGLTFDLAYTREYMPPNIYDFYSGTPLAYNGAWTYFFLNASSNYPSSSMESIFTTAYSDYANWYNRTLGHISWHPFNGRWEWSRWYWPPGSGTSYGDGVPQNIDGDSSESFYL